MIDKLGCKLQKTSVGWHRFMQRTAEIEYLVKCKLNGTGARLFKPAQNASCDSRLFCSWGVIRFQKSRSIISFGPSFAAALSLAAVSALAAVRSCIRA
jgi:hypothetical protein